MQLTRFTDYSLRVLIFLGAHPDRLCTISEIASSYGISENHLMKVVNHLSTDGYVETLRGKGGGMRLSRQPHLINIGEVVRDTEDNMNIVECFDQERRDCPLLPSCVLKAALSEARKNFMSTLDRYSLRDMLGQQTLSQFAIKRGVRIPVRPAVAGRDE
jgi:Rrf2 family nitric oxide-sensitive transcriptional repressor